MPARQEPSEPAATRPQPEDHVRPSTLLALTSLGAMDGTVVLLAAQGVLSTWIGAVVVGLTVIAGAGAWITARQAFGGRPKTARDLAALGAVAVASSLATVAAAWLGDLVHGNITLYVLPRLAGLVLLLVAVEVGGWRLPRPAGVPLPAVAVAGALLLEGVAHWTPL